MEAPIIISPNYFRLTLLLSLYSIMSFAQTNDNIYNLRIKKIEDYNSTKKYDTTKVIQGVNPYTNYDNSTPTKVDTAIINKYKRLALLDNQRQTVSGSTVTINIIVNNSNNNNSSWSNRRRRNNNNRNNNYLNSFGNFIPYPYLMWNNVNGWSYGATFFSNNYMGFGNNTYYNNWNNNYWNNNWNNSNWIIY